MKPDSVCISFYGWGMVDRFFAAWNDAGFKAVGHIVWAKDYASRRGLLDYHHEQAYVLAKAGLPGPPGPFPTGSPGCMAATVSIPPKRRFASSSR